MTPTTKEPFWPRARRYFRRCRLVVWTLALLVLGGFLYLNHFGVPGFVKRPVIEELRSRGVELEFRRLRLRWFRGLVADDVRFSGTDAAGGAQFTAREAELNLGLRALLRGKIRLDAVGLRGGRLELPVAGAPARPLAVTNIEARLRLLPDDEWSLDHFQAGFAGVRISASGAIRHASAIRNWTLLHGDGRPRTNQFPARLKKIADTLDRVSFDATPVVRLVLDGDARDPGTFSLRLVMQADAVRTPWCAMTNALVAGQLHAATAARLSRAEIKIEAASVQTPRGGAEKIRLDVTVAALTNPPPADAALSWWTTLQPYQLGWRGEVGALRLEKVAADKIVFGGQWLAPQLAVTNLGARLYGGKFSGRGSLDIVTREAEFGLESDFDVKGITPVMRPKTQTWFGKYTWATPPRLHGTGAVTLPEWTNAQPDWRGEVLPTLRLAGAFAVTNGAYLGIPADWARAHVTYTNMVWRLPDLEAGRPEGWLRAEHFSDDRTRDYWWRARGAFDPRILRPVLKTNAQRALDQFTFTEPLRVEGELWGRYNAHGRIGFALHTALTNFTFRAQSVGGFDSQLRFTNFFLEFLAPKIVREGTQEVNAAGIALDVEARRMWFTNGFSTAEPMVVARAIGPRTAHALEPYKFLTPPAVRVDGLVPFNGEGESDLRFNVDGGPFEWLKFRVPRITGDVLWQGKSLALSNVVTEFYDGVAAGGAHFDLRQTNGTDFRFNVDFTNANLLALMADVSTHSNKMEGRLSGSLVVTNANSRDRHTWDGHGEMKLRDGFIWEVPVFGSVSSALNAVGSGIVGTRVTDGAARFIITNGVMFTPKFEMKSPSMRLLFAGTVSFDGEVNARVEAELLRDMWFFGPLMSKVLWPVSKLLEYKVTGTLRNPRSEPLHAPAKLLMMPLHPIRTIEDLLPGDPGRTNVFKELPDARPGEIELWNGKDLGGWKTYFTNEGVDAAKIWTAEDGVLKLAGGAKGYLRTENSFENYHLHAEWRWPVTNGNSGVFVHMNGPDAIWPVSVECQLKSGSAGELVGQGGVDFPAPLINGKKRAKITTPSERPVGEWNEYDIWCRSNSIGAFVNGVPQNRIEPVTVSNGAVGLQMEGSPVEFRKIWVGPLDEWVK